MDISTIIFIAILVYSIVLHEISHGYAAYLLGDPTAKMRGRLTLNPFSHIDILGSIIIPAFLILSGSGFLFGWAKPVPYNPYNLKKGGRYAEVMVALAGPFVNMLIALFVLFLFKLSVINASVAYMVMYMNVFLAFLNLLPIPPLDGSKILPALLPNRFRVSFEEKIRNFDSFGFSGMILTLLFLSFFVARPLAAFVGNIVSILLLI